MEGAHDNIIVVLWVEFVALYLLLLFMSSIVDGGYGLIVRACVVQKRHASCDRRILVEVAAVTACVADGIHKLDLVRT